MNYQKFLILPNNNKIYNLNNSKHNNNNICNNNNYLINFNLIKSLCKNRLN